MYKCPFYFSEGLVCLLELWIGSSATLWKGKSILFNIQMTLFIELNLERELIVIR